MSFQKKYFMDKKYSVRYIYDKNNNKYFVLCDIKELLGFDFKDSAGSVFRYLDKKYMISYSNFIKNNIDKDSKNQSKTVLGNEDSIKIIIHKTQKGNLEGLYELCKEFNIEYEDYKGFDDSTIKSIHKEQKYITCLVKSFQKEELKREFKVGKDKYRIDLYFIDYKLAIECDEFGHKRYKKEDEKEREEYIKKVLGCTFIRFNPDSKNFNIFDVISEIFSFIIKEKNSIIDNKNKYITKLETKHLINEE